MSLMFLFQCIQASRWSLRGRPGDARAVVGRRPKAAPPKSKPALGAKGERSGKLAGGYIQQEGGSVRLARIGRGTQVEWLKGLWGGIFSRNLQARFLHTEINQGKRCTQKKICRPEIYVHDQIGKSLYVGHGIGLQTYAEICRPGSTYSETMRTSVGWHVVTKKNRWWQMVGKIPCTQSLRIGYGAHQGGTYHGHWVSRGGRVLWRAALQTGPCVEGMWSYP